MALNKKRKRRNRLIFLVIIFAVLTAIAFAVFMQGESWLKENLAKIAGPDYSPALLVLLTFLASFLLSFVPEIFGSDIRSWFFGLEDDEHGGVPPPPQVQPIVNVNIDRNALLQSDPVPAPPQPVSAAASDLKFYPPDFLPDFKYFVGREELLKKLETVLKKHHRASIHDISGLGKTFATLKFASDHQAEYQKIFFINAAKESYLESMAEIAVMLTPELAQNENQQERALGLKAWLEKNEEWLAIYDNVDEPAVLKPFIPNNLKGDCIFTSNFRAVENIAPHRIEIDELEPEFARILLYSRARNKPESEPEFPGDAERQAFENLITGIDGLPIALLTTGAIIYRDQLGFAEFWEMFQKADAVVLEAEDEFGDYKKKSALRAFSIALDDISKDSKSDPKTIKAEKAAVREMLNAACFLFPDDIPEEFLQKFVVGDFPSKSIFGLIMFVINKLFKRNRVISDSHWIKLRNRFTNFDLFKFDSTAKSFSTHRLIQKCIFLRLSDADKNTYAERVLNTVKGFFPIYDYTNKKECERYYQHTLAALEHADRTGFEAGVTVDLYFRVARYQRLLGSYAQAEKFYARNLEISRKVYGEEAAETATSLNNLANVYESQGKYDEAIGLYKEDLKITEKTQGKEHSEYATSLNNLANVYKAQKDYERAIPMYEDAIKIKEKSLGADHIKTATSYLELAACYGGLKRYDEAFPLFQRVLDNYKNNLGADHPWVATALNSLARVYGSQEKYSDALPPL
jgi:tetratricopeptide (TPR) repeat protein